MVILIRQRCAPQPQISRCVIKLAARQQVLCAKAMLDFGGYYQLVNNLRRNLAETTRSLVRSSVSVIDSDRKRAQKVHGTTAALAFRSLIAQQLYPRVGSKTSVLTVLAEGRIAAALPLLHKSYTHRVTVTQWRTTGVGSVGKVHVCHFVGITWYNAWS